MNLNEGVVFVEIRGTTGDWTFGGWFGNEMSKTGLLAAGIGDLKLVFGQDVPNSVAGGGDWGFEACF
jgi:hypothetical protein